MTDNELYELTIQMTEQFKKEVEEEYSVKKMSGNLAKTLKVSLNPRTFTSTVFIQAPKYDIWTYWYKRVVVPLNTGSYAEDNDAGSGGIKRGKGEKYNYVLIETNISGKRLKMKPTMHHLNFVRRCLTKTITHVMKANGIKEYTIDYKGRR